MLAAAGCGGPPAKLSEIETQIFARSCAFSTCHRGASPAGGMGLDGNTHAKLVGVPSTGAPDRIRVVAGDPGASYVMEKLTSAKPAAGTQMPPTEMLSPERIETIRGWIAAGAKND